MSAAASESSGVDSFRSEVRSWLAANAPAEVRGVLTSIEGQGNWGGRRPTFDPPQMKTWMEVMVAKGWTAPTWPTEYGGGGLSAEQAKVLEQELAAAKLPPPLMGFGLEMIGPTLLNFGSEEQKREHLTKIARGEIRWCQGYSEPDSGSDLASLQTRAVRDGDHFIVNGRKVWTSYGDLADWIFALVRTDPAAKKQEGITFLLIDMETPGVSVRPIRLISGKSPFCETIFDDVRVPVKNAIGKINGGWTVAKALLGYERAMIADAFGASTRGASKKKPAQGSRLVQLARQYEQAARSEPQASEVHQGRPLSDAVLRDEIAQLEMDERAFHLTVQRSRDAAKAGHRPGPESSLFKVYATELNKDRHELMVRIAGAQGLGWDGPGYDDEEIALTRQWLRSRGNSIEGGTSEVQLNIIAKRVLGLPD
jgi:alkylation response protein AidB-like acyl-CoA dehydrogenase